MPGKACQGWQGAHGDRQFRAVLTGVAEARFRKAVPSQNSVDFNPEAVRRHHRRHLGDARSRPFIAKLMGLFMNFDTLIGKDFEVGLANLKKADRASPR